MASVSHDQQQDRMTPMEALTFVKSAFATRAAAIEKSQQIYRDARSTYDAESRRARDTHREGNRQFVAAVRRAHEAAGLKIGLIVREIGTSYQFFNRLEQQVKNWDEEGDR